MARTNLSDADYGVIADFKGDTFTNLKTKLNEHDSALDAVGAPTISTETKTSGALTVATKTSFVSVTGTVAFTLADGTISGQEKIIECTVAATSPLGTLTITTPNTGEGATHVFTAVGQRIVLVWLTTGWHMISKTRAGRETVVIGTTVLQGATANSGHDLALGYDLSVTGTVSSTTTKSLPSGTVPGERCHIDVTTAAISASGTFAFVGLTAVGAAVTQAAGIGNGGTDKSFALELFWDGTSWQICFLGTNTGVTIS